VRIRIDDGKKVRRVKIRRLCRRRAAEDHVKLLERPQAEASIGAVAGPGAFSATRTGVALANALAYAWNIPIVALSQAQFDAERVRCRSG
jgi:tRNA A37 threonylcarbamoyltransferase TsaD